MDYEKYDGRASADFLRYEFYSEGPKGRIAKRIVYRKIEDKPDVYNLSFGDVNEEDGINDRVVTDNGDTMKILATVAQTLTPFFSHHPDKWVFVKGSTAGRTRLYRMVIGKNFDEFAKNLEIMGLTGMGWELFRRNGVYGAFIARKKIPNITA